MIKINLLNSVTERNNGAVVAVERKIGSAASRLLMMCIAVGVMLIVVIGWDVISTQRAKADAEAELQEQQRVAAELETILNEQKDLDQKIQNIDTRIGVIKKLRASQAGPSAVLEAIRERITMTPGIYLESIEQKGDQLTIKGNSSDEGAVTQFGRSLEFSSGLFTNLNIETQRQESPNVPVSAGGNDAPAPPSIVNFTIRCAYTPEKAGASKDSSAMKAQNSPANQPAPPANQPPPPPQVAKNQMQ